MVRKYNVCKATELFNALSDQRVKEDKEQEKMNVQLIIFFILIFR